MEHLHTTPHQDDPAGAGPAARRCSPPGRRGRRSGRAGWCRLVAPVCAPVVALGLLGGCQTMEGALQKVGQVVADAAKADQAAAKTAGGGAGPAPGVVRNGIRGTELDGIFKKTPVTSTQNPQTWPRVAITVKSGTPGVFRLAGQGSLGPHDCVTFDIRLWRSATDGKRFDGLQLCVEAVEKESKGVAFRNLDILGQYTVHKSMNSTAGQRTDGPNPPFYTFPQDIGSQHGWAMTSQNTRYFLGAIFLSLGWDWDNDFDRRLWVVAVPPAPIAR